MRDIKSWNLLRIYGNLLSYADKSGAALSQAAPATDVGNKSLRALTSLIGNMSLKEQKEQLTFVKTNVSKTNWESKR